MCFDKKEYTEQDWRNDADARERAEERRVRDHMQDYTIEAAEKTRAENQDQLLTTALDGFARPGLLRDGAESQSMLESQLRASIDYVIGQRAASQTKARC